MTNPTERSLPRVDLKTFEDIVEGRRTCPTLKELADLAEKEANFSKSASSEKVRDHLNACVDCQSHFEALVIVARATGRAFETALKQDAG